MHMTIKSAVVSSKKCSSHGTYVICYDAVSELKNEHPEIKRIYVRAENEYIDGEGSRAYREGLYELYEDTYHKCV